MSFIGNTSDEGFKWNKLPADTYYVVDETGEVYDTATEAEDACRIEPTPPIPEDNATFNSLKNTLVEGIQKRGSKLELYDGEDKVDILLMFLAKHVHPNTLQLFDIFVEDMLDKYVDYQNAPVEYFSTYSTHDVVPLYITRQRSFYREGYSVNINRGFDSIPADMLARDGDFDSHISVDTKEEAETVARDWAERWSLKLPDEEIEVTTDTAEFGGDVLAVYKNGKDISEEGEPNDS